RALRRRHAVPEGAGLRRLPGADAIVGQALLPDVPSTLAKRQAPGGGGRERETARSNESSQGGGDSHRPRPLTDCDETLLSASRPLPAPGVSPTCPIAAAPVHFFPLVNRRHECIM